MMDHVSQLYRKIPGVEEAAVGVVGNELTFGFPRVLDVIALCTANEIAVLGLELFEVLPEGYVTRNYSLYDQEEELRRSPANADAWTAYVRENNIRAGKFVRGYPAGKGHVYVLTVASWNESSGASTPKRR